MKVTITIEFEAPDELKKYSEQELREAYWEELLHYAQCKHLEDALHWHLKAATGETNAQIISDHHQLWAKYLQTGKTTKFVVS